ncbi:MAG: hypothetical protein H7145_16525 [Akkermansiaceae bacterium]|nr:hypothetical protein [Armatimonadota bacterium]
MQTQALLEQLPNRQFRVTGSGRFAVSAEGATEEEAVANFRHAAVHAVKQARLITVDIPLESGNGSHPTEQPGGTGDAFVSRLGRGAKISEDDWQSYQEALRHVKEEDNARVTDD